MQIRARLFASLRDAAEIGECWLELAPGGRGLEAKAALAARYPRLQDLVEYARLSVNWEYRSWETPLQDGDEIGFLLPVSGG